MQFQIAAKLSPICCHLVNTYEKLGVLATLIAPFCQTTLVFVVILVILMKCLAGQLLVS